jgi:hypothetical protein
MALLALQPSNFRQLSYMLTEGYSLAGFDLRIICKVKSLRYWSRRRGQFISPPSGRTLIAPTCDVCPATMIVSSEASRPLQARLIVSPAHPARAGVAPLANAAQWGQLQAVRWASKCRRHGAAQFVPRAQGRSISAAPVPLSTSGGRCPFGAYGNEGARRHGACKLAFRSAYSVARKARRVYSAGVPWTIYTIRMDYDRLANCLLLYLGRQALRQGW